MEYAGRESLGVSVEVLWASSKGSIPVGKLVVILTSMAALVECRSLGCNSAVADTPPLGTRPDRRAPTRGGLAERSKGVPQVVLCDVAPENDTSHAGEVIVQACPEARIDDLVAKIVRHVEVAYRIQVADRAGGVEAVDIEVEALSAEEVAEDISHRGCDRADRSGVFRMVRRRQKRPPAQLLDRSRVAIVKPRDGTETISSDGRRVDGCDRPPKQIVVLREQARDQRVGADYIDHCCQPRRLEQPKAVVFGNIACKPVVLTDNIRRPEPCDRGLL